MASTSPAFAGRLFLLWPTLVPTGESDREPQIRRLKVKSEQLVEPELHDHLVLLQARTELSSVGSKAKTLQAAVKSTDDLALPSGWFGDFSQDESTFTPEGVDASNDDPARAVKYGADPSLESPYKDWEVVPSKFFHESVSGGAKAAWQTNYPSLETGVAGNRVAENRWKETPEGWVQEYRNTV